MRKVNEYTSRVYLKGVGNKVTISIEFEGNLFETLFISNLKCVTCVFLFGFVSHFLLIGKTKEHVLNKLS